MAKPINFIRPNFISESIKKHGDIFLDVMNQQELERGMSRLARDIVRGAIDINVHGIYLLDERLLGSLMYYVATQYNKFFFYTQWGDNFYANYKPTTEYEIQQLEDSRKSANAYMFFLKKLEKVKMYRDINLLANLRNELKSFRYNI